MNKNSFLGLATLVVTVALLFNSCVKDVGKTPVVPPTPPPGVCDSATYNIKIKAIIDAKCTSCHSPAGGPSGSTNLTNYAEVSAKGDRVKARAIDANPSIMPPSGNTPLTADEKTLIQCWLDKGKPE